MFPKRLVTIALAAALCCWTADAEVKHYDVACPGVNSELHCPVGHVIRVVDLSYGVQTPDICAARNVSAPPAAGSCLRPMMLIWSKMICNHLPHCRLSKPHADMFKCNDTQDFFMQYTYVCEPKDPAVKTKILCDHSQDDIECDYGVISIVKALYGRVDSNTCTRTPSEMTFCASFKAPTAVRSSCNGFPECELTASNATMGRPVLCDNHPKYLRVDYTCV